MATMQCNLENMISRTIKDVISENKIYQNSEENIKETANNTNNTRGKLLDKDKLILIFYIGIDDLSNEKAYDTLQDITQEIKGMFDESVKPIIMPVRDSKQLKVEPIYIQTISNNEDKNHLVEVINRLEEAIQKLYDAQIA